MKRFVRKDLPLSVAIATATFVIVALTGAKGDAVSLILGGVLALAILCQRLHEPPRSDDALKGRSGGGRSTGSR